MNLLQEGAVGVLPTDTVYGLVALAAHPTAVHRLYGLKKRQQKPGTLIAADLDQLVGLGIPRRYLTAVQHFWPNPVSVIVPTTPELHYLDQGKMSLAMRIPKGAALSQLLRQTGPLLTTSANLPGEMPAQTIEEAKKYFDDTVDFYVDAGSREDSKGSTVIRVIDDAVEVVREGAVQINEKGEITA